MLRFCFTVILPVLAYVHVPFKPCKETPNIASLYYEIKNAEVMCPLKWIAQDAYNRKLLNSSSIKAKYGVRSIVLPANLFTFKRLFFKLKKRSEKTHRFTRLLYDMFMFIDIQAYKLVETQKRRMSICEGKFSLGSHPDMFQRGYLRSSLPHPVKIQSRNHGLTEEEQMLRRRQDFRRAQEQSRLANKKRAENEYHETKTLMFECIENGVLNMNRIAQFICSLKGRNALNSKAYDEFVHSEQAMTAIPCFDDLNLRNDKTDIWLNILADRLQCEIDRARIHQNAMKINVKSYYRLQEVKFTGAATAEISDENFGGRKQG